MGFISYARKDTFFAEPRFAIKEWHEEEYRPILIGCALDVPRTELDDRDHNIGLEDKENNLFGIVEVDRSYLEEDKVIDLK